MNAISFSGGLSIGLVFAAIASALIPAAVIKALMSIFFQRNISYLMTVIALLGSIAAIFGISYVLGIRSDAALRALPQNATYIFTGATIFIQAAFLALIVSDDIQQRIELWKWLLVLVLQYVCFFLFGVGLDLALSL